MGMVIPTVVKQGKTGLAEKRCDSFFTFRPPFSDMAWVKTMHAVMPIWYFRYTAELP